MVSDLKPREQSVVLVPSTGMEDFEASLARLNKRAESFGLDPIKVLDRATREYFWKHHDTSSGTEAILKQLGPGEEPPKGEAIWLVHALTLDYPIIKLGNWAVVGQIEAKEDGNLLFSVSQNPDDVAQMQKHAFCAIGCEHCNTKRSRKQSYLLKDDQGEYKEVGSTCLEDFTGIDPAAALFMQRMYLFWSEYGEDELLGHGGRVSAFPTKGYLARVLFCIEHTGGFMSASKGRDMGLMATYEHAAFLDQDLRQDEKLRDKFYGSYDRHSEYAQKIIDWWAQAPDTDSFAHNVKLLLQQENIEIKNKHMAFAAAAVQGYQRHLVRLESAKTSEHVGEVGEKRDQPMRLHSVSSWDSEFGAQWRINLSDEAGNRYSWRTGRPPAELLEPQAVGRNFKSRFKIKGHEEFKGIAITEVLRLKFDGWLDLEKTQIKDIAVLTVQPDTSAFEDIGLREELASIVRSSAQLVDARREPFDVCDTNGNKVGSVVFEEPAEDVSPGSVRVWLHLDGDESVAPLAEAIASALAANETVVLDASGQVIGSVEVGSDVAWSVRADVPRDDLAFGH